MTDLTPTHEMLESEVEFKSMGLATELHYPGGTLRGTLDRGRMQPKIVLVDRPKY